MRFNPSPQVRQYIYIGVSFLLVMMVATGLVTSDDLTKTIEGAIALIAALTSLMAARNVEP